MPFCRRRCAAGAIGRRIRMATEYDDPRIAEVCGAAGPSGAADDAPVDDPPAPVAAILSFQCRSRSLADRISPGCHRTPARFGSPGAGRCAGRAGRLQRLAPDRPDGCRWRLTTQFGPVRHRRDLRLRLRSAADPHRARDANRQPDETDDAGFGFFADAPGQGSESLRIRPAVGRMTVIRLFRRRARQRTDRRYELRHHGPRRISPGGFPPAEESDGYGIFPIPPEASRSTRSGRASDSSAAVPAWSGWPPWPVRIALDDELGFGFFSRARLARDAAPREASADTGAAASPSRPRHATVAPHRASPQTSRPRPIRPSASASRRSIS
jgi:hypothetical protein